MHVYMLKKTLERVYRKLQGYLISRFNKYPRNPQSFLSSKLIRPTVFGSHEHVHYIMLWILTIDI